MRKKLLYQTRSLFKQSKPQSTVVLTKTEKLLLNANIQHHLPDKKARLPSVGNTKMILAIVPIKITEIAKEAIKMSTKYTIQILKNYGGKK